LVAFLALDAAQIDAIENHGQVGGADLQAVAISCNGRETMASFL